MKKVLSILLIVIMLITAFVSCDDTDNIPITICKHDDPTKIITVSAKPATCQEDGLTSGMKCTACDTMVVPQIIIPAFECVESPWIIDKEATVEANGLKHTECIYCGAVFKEETIIFVEVTPDVEYEITLWVPTSDGVKEFIEIQIENFKKEHPEYKFNITIEAVSEGDAAFLVLRDFDSAPDMYCFAQDQISRLVAGGALSPLGTAIAQKISNENDVGSVGAATVGDRMYAYPMTSDNGYFLYYDSSIVSDEEAKTLEGIVAACERSGKKFGYELMNAWIMSSFFFSQPVGGGAPLCTSTWTYSADGKFPIAVNDTFNSENGLIAMKAMDWLTNSGVWIDTMNNFAGTGAIVSGIWGASQAEDEYGDNMRATKLPTFTVDGETYQLGSFSGYKLLGCKPQEDPLKEEICQALALYLTSEEAQLDRYYELQWGPSNVEAQNNQDVKDNVYFSALLEQNVYAQLQGVIHSDWWTEAAALGTKCKEADLTDDDLKAALATYEERLQDLIVKQRHIKRQTKRQG